MNSLEDEPVYLKPVAHCDIAKSCAWIAPIQLITSGAQLNSEALIFWLDNRIRAISV